MAVKPFLKWAGGKRWLVERDEFIIPPFSGRYIEPFLGGGAVFFSLCPNKSIISDTNFRLIETYISIKNDWKNVVNLLKAHHDNHGREYYYKERSKQYTSEIERASQFLYLNRACWNGLYRENLKGEFNVPIGTKSKILFENDDFELISNILKNTEIRCCDFATIIEFAGEGDLLFVDPPYTTAHNMNGFVKYNQKIFSWEDQLRLKECLVDAYKRGCIVITTNAWHESVVELYKNNAEIQEIPRFSVISGSRQGRKETSESLIIMGINK